jgi:hypothetical protein
MASHHIASWHRIIHHFALIHTLENKENSPFSFGKKLMRIAFDNGILMQRLRQELHTRFGKERGFLSKREKKERCFFAAGSKTVCTKVSRITKKYITSIYIQIVHKCFLQNQEPCTRTLNYKKYTASVFFSGLCRQLRSTACRQLRQ